MRIIKCDRCGAEIPNDVESTGYVALNWRSTIDGCLTDDNPFEYWDLCEDCIKAIQAFIQKPTKEEKFEKIVESVDAGKKKSRVLSSTSVRHRRFGMHTDPSHGSRKRWV